MKKSLVAASLGLMVSISVHGQGAIVLYNYNNPETAITYAPFQGGGLGNQPVPASSAFTVGVFWALSSSVSVSAVNDAMAGDPGYGPIPFLTVGVGPNSTVALGTDQPGLFSSTTSPFVMAGVPSGASVTLVLVAYNGASYYSSSERGHSRAFSMVASAILPQEVGPFIAGFQVGHLEAWTPEPTSFAIAGLGVVVLWLRRR
jgi:hypothetical protein